MLWGKVSVEAARADYGAVVTGTREAPVVDLEASDSIRDDRRRASAAMRGDGVVEPFFDRGPGYATLASGATSADVDWL